MSADVAVVRGRPRSAEVDRAIAEAALAVLTEDGAARFSVEAVAQKAGVGKATIYRRFAGSRELLAEALGTLNDDLVTPPAGLCTRDALIMVVEGIRLRALNSTPDRCLPQVLSEAHRSPELFDIYYERVVRPRRDRVIRVIRDGVARGEIRSDIDAELLASLFTAPMVSLMVMTPAAHRTADHTTAEAIVDAVLNGVTQNSVAFAPAIRDGKTTIATESAQ